MSDFKKHLEKSLKDEKLAREWEKQSVERDIMHQIVEAEVEKGVHAEGDAKPC